MMVQQEYPPQADAVEIEPDAQELERDSPLENIPSEIEDATSSAASYEIVSIPADFTLEGLASKWEKKKLEIPGFQRKFIWTQKQASRLIESFMLGLPVPSLFLYADPDTGAQQVIDGQQRLMSVVQFFEGQFKNANMGKARIFRLTGLTEGSPYEDCTVEDLQDKHPVKLAELNDAVMRAFLIKQLNPKDATSIYHIFERLNTGGTRLLGQEIRNCVYHGPLNELICSLNLNPDWRQIIGKENPDARMRDVEMILRFIALYFFADTYKKPMKDFLSTAMRNKRYLQDEEKELVTRIFRKTCKIILDTLGTRPFHGWNAMNPAMFDAVFTTIAKHEKIIPDDLRTRCESLLKNDEFKSQASYRTTDPDAVSRRLELARVTLFGT